VATFIRVHFNYAAEPSVGYAATIIGRDLTPKAGVLPRSAALTMNTMTIVSII